MQVMENIQQEQNFQQGKYKTESQLNHNQAHIKHFKNHLEIRKPT